MKMSFNQAQTILDRAGVVEGFIEPDPNVSEYVADAMFRRHEQAERNLDAAIMGVLREMVIDEAKQVVHDALIPGRR